MTDHNAATQKTRIVKQNDVSSQTFSVAKATKELQQKFEECIPRRKVGKSIKAPKPMTEIN